MTEPELREWLGLGSDYDGRTLNPKLIIGMLDMPVPSSPDAQLEAFRKFLRIVGPLPLTVFAEDSDRG